MIDTLFIYPYYKTIILYVENTMYDVISFSGGRTSAYMVSEVLKINPDAHIIFMDTGAEHPATYQFIRDIVAHWKIKLTCLRAWPNEKMGKPGMYEIVDLSRIGPDLEPWKRMLNKYGHPYVGGAFCTDRMKTVPFTKYCQDVFGKGNYTTWLGIRTDEPKRLKARDGFRYLADISDFEKQDVLDWWEEQPFDLAIQEHLGNCVFCIKKSLQKVALAAKDEPELAGQFLEMLGDDRMMYRSNNTLSQVITLFGDTGRDELASRMRSMRQYDTGSCSESCEAFPVQAVEIPHQVHDSGSISYDYADRIFFANWKQDEGYYYVIEVTRIGSHPIGKFVNSGDIDEAIVEHVRNNPHVRTITSPYDYHQDDDQVTALGGGVYICYLDNKFYMGSYDESYYDGNIDNPWQWQEIDKVIYDTLEEARDR